MRGTLRIWLALLYLAALLVQMEGARAGSTGIQDSDGKTILLQHCAGCHSIDKIGRSPLGQAPPLRDIYRQYQIERLEFELAEGIGSRHPKMPQIQFSMEQIQKILDYLKTLAETDQR